MLASPQVGDPELRSQLIALLQKMGAGYLDLPGPDDPVDAILRDAVGFPTPASPSRTPVIQLLRHRTPMQRGGLTGNPFSDQSVRHWLAINPAPDLEELKTTLESATQGGYIPLTRLLGDDARIVTAHEMDSLNKDRHIDRLNRFFADANLPTPIVGALPSLLEESLSNALYDAPVAAKHRGDATGISRSTRVRTGRPVTIRFGRSPRMVAISVRDFYGALTPTRVIERLAQCYSLGGAHFEDKEGGAGLGFFFMLQNASRVVLNCKAGHFTEVIVLRRIDQRGGEFRRAAPTLNICFGSASAPGRRCHRIPVRWPVQCELKSSLFESTVRDVTARGAFLELPSAQAGPDLGQVIRLSFLPAGSNFRVETRAAVRWRGLSDEHYAQGVGVTFEKPLPLRALFDIKPPEAFQFRGQRFEVQEVVSTRCVAGRFPGEGVIHDFRVRASTRGEYRLRYNWLADSWSVWVADDSRPT